MDPDGGGSHLRWGIGQRRGLEDWEVLDLLSSLVDKSLVVYDSQQSCDARYHLLETMRQYSLDRLRESGDGDGVRQRHAQWFKALAEDAAPRLREVDQATRARGLCAVGYLSFSMATTRSWWRWPRNV